MTRERLLKVARRKDADVQKKTYDKLCHMLEKPENRPRKSSIISQGNRKAGNRFVNAHIRKLERMTEELNTSHKKMLAKLKAELSDKEKQELKTVLENMQAAIEVCKQHTSDLGVERLKKEPIIMERLN